VKSELLIMILLQNNLNSMSVITKKKNVRHLLIMSLHKLFTMVLKYNFKYQIILLMLIVQTITRLLYIMSYIMERDYFGEKTLMAIGFPQNKYGLAIYKLT